MTGGSWNIVNNAQLISSLVGTYPAADQSPRSRGSRQKPPSVVNISVIKKVRDFVIREVSFF